MITAGIDVGKRTHAACFMRQDGQQIGKSPHLRLERQVQVELPAAVDWSGNSDITPAIVRLAELLEKVGSCFRNTRPGVRALLDDC